MTDRMTDGRLAELTALWIPARDSVNRLGKLIIELLRALKAERNRIAELKARIYELTHPPESDICDDEIPYLSDEGLEEVGAE